MAEKRTTFVVIPYQSVGDLSFGMERDEVRELMGEFHVIPQGTYDTNSADSFYDNAIDCYYNKNNRFFGIVIMNKYSVVLDDKTIMPSSEKDFAAMFADAILEYDGENMTWVPSIGVTAYNYDEEVSSLTIGSKEFYGDIIKQ